MGLLLKMVFFSLRKIRSIGIVTAQVLQIKSISNYETQRRPHVQAGVLVLVLRVLEHGPNLNLPGQQPLQV